MRYGVMWVVGAFRPEVSLSETQTDQPVGVIPLLAAPELPLGSG